MVSRQKVNDHLSFLKSAHIRGQINESRLPISCLVKYKTINDGKEEFVIGFWCEVISVFQKTYLMSSGFGEKVGLDVHVLYSRLVV